MLAIPTAALLLAAGGLGQVLASEADAAKGWAERARGRAEAVAGDDLSDRALAVAASPAGRYGAPGVGLVLLLLALKPARISRIIRRSDRILDVFEGGANLVAQFGEPGTCARFSLLYGQGDISLFMIRSTLCGGW